MFTFAALVIGTIVLAALAAPLTPGEEMRFRHQQEVMGASRI